MAKEHHIGLNSTLIGGVLAILSSIGFPTIADATSVAPMTVQTLADHAGQVLIGDVTSTRSYWANNPRRIETEVIFRNVEYIKGKLQNAGTDFTLIVPGGTVGDTRMRICCAPEFKAGERRLLFLLPRYKTFPTVGVAQGAFRIEKDETGVDRVYQHGQILVVGVDEKGFVKLATERRITDASSHLVDSHRTQLKQQQAAETPKAISCSDFLNHIRPILDNSRDHRLIEPAGQRDLVSKTGVSLKASQAWRATSGLIVTESGPAKSKSDKLRTANQPSGKAQTRQRSRTSESSDDNGGKDR